MSQKIAANKLIALGLDLSDKKVQEFLATFVREDTKAAIVGDMLGVNFVQEEKETWSGHKYKMLVASDCSVELKDMFYSMVKINTKTLEFIRDNGFSVSK